jgi:hypothetical protein
MLYSIFYDNMFKMDTENEYGVFKLKYTLSV